MVLPSGRPIAALNQRPSGSVIDVVPSTPNEESADPAGDASALPPPQTRLTATREQTRTSRVDRATTSLASTLPARRLSNAGMADPPVAGRACEHGSVRTARRVLGVILAGMLLAGCAHRDDAGGAR